jgi:Glyoxalase-like domain
VGAEGQAQAGVDVRWSTPVKALLDHLVLAADSLATGVPLVERVLPTLAPGGQHPRMGTHNRVLRIGDRAYLEVIAIDPEGVKPDRPRWFSLDDPAMRQQLAEGPRLIHWAVQVESTTLPPLPFDPGPWESFERGPFSWKLTVREDGTLPAEGIVPSLICWDGPAHPTARLAESGCTIEAVELEHPQAAEVQHQLNVLGLPHRCAPGPVPRLTVLLRTPAGARVLRSTEPLRAA